jgi:SNW domain-containing protein 1
MARTVLRQQKTDQEVKLRDLAARARAGMVKGKMAGEEGEGAPSEDREAESYDEATKARGSDDEAESEEAIAERDAREELRKDRKREMKHELRKEQIKNEARKAGKTKAAREEDRAVSEKIALGQAVKGGAKDGGFDARLFNQAQGMDAGFTAEDDYGVYDKPLFKGGAQTYIYRAKKDGEGELLKDAEEVSEKDAEGKMRKILEKGTARFQPDKGFKGTEDGASGQPRSQPVQFEKESEDLFGLGELLGEASRGGANKKGNALDKIGGRGHMTASAGGASSRAEDYSGFNPHSKGMQFEEASEDGPPSSSSSSSTSSSQGQRRGRDARDSGRADDDSSKRRKR